MRPSSKVLCPTHPPTEIELHSEQEADWLGQDDDGGASVDEVDHEEWQGGNGGQEELVAPLKVEHVISKAKEDHAADGEEGRDELGKL